MSETMVETRERPILFSGEMVRAILGERKTQTRRLITTRMEHASMWSSDGRVYVSGDEARMDYDVEPDVWTREIHCPYGAVGDRLYVRETWAGLRLWGGPVAYAYRADMPEEGKDVDKWKPSIHMPREASRIDLEITGVRVERLQDISEADVLAEGITVDRAAKWTGIPWSDMPDLYTAFRYCWDHLNSERAPWSSNPWVWVISFQPAHRAPRGGV